MRIGAALGTLVVATAFLALASPPAEAGEDPARALEGAPVLEEASRAPGGAPTTPTSVVGETTTPTSVVGETTTPTSVVGETTTTLPDGGAIGDIVPEPNSGREPQTPGDPGGWQQIALFFALCAVVLGIAAYLVWRSRKARSERAAEGRDPVTRARGSGGDVRKPRPPGID